MDSFCIKTTDSNMRTPLQSSLVFKSRESACFLSRFLRNLAEEQRTGKLQIARLCRGPGLLLCVTKRTRITFPAREDRECSYENTVSACTRTRDINVSEIVRKFGGINSERIRKKLYPCFCQTCIDHYRRFLPTSDPSFFLSFSPSLALSVLMNSAR